MEIKIDSYAGARTSSRVLKSTGNTAFGQCFTAIDCVLHSFKFLMRKFASPTGSAVAKLYAISGTYGTNAIPTGSVLATSDNFDVSTLTTTYTLVEFLFTGEQKILLTNTTKYYAVIEYSGGNDTDFLVGGLGTASPHGGNNAYYAGSWTADNQFDMEFEIYGIIPTIITVSPMSLTLSFKDFLLKYWAKPLRTSTSYSNNSKNSSTFTQYLRHGKEPSMSDLENYTFQSVVFDSGETLEDITFAELQNIVWTNINKSS